MNLEANKVRREILQFLKNRANKAFRPKEMARQLSYLSNKEYRTFRGVLAEMEKSREVTRVKGNRFIYSRVRKETLQGVLEMNADGFGFVRVDGYEDDFYVAPKRLGTALHRDLVEIELLAPVRGSGKKRREAEVREVVERRLVQTVGTFFMSGSLGYVRSDENRLIYDIYVAEKDIMDAIEGEKVLVSIDRFDDAKGTPVGRVLQRLGPADDPRVAVLAVAMSKGVEEAFPANVLQAAEEIDVAIPESEISRRVDLRKKDVFTIDPSDAKDFDDAIHISRLPNGNLEVGVHIADVSYYVRNGSILDSEAFKRATSVYLVDRVIPMLPEHLSNQACSLRPEEDKLTYSCLLELTPSGETVRHDFAETIIHSRFRLSYEEAQEVIDGGNHPLSASILLAHETARTLRSNRFASGSIAFDRPEAKVILNDDGYVDRIEKRIMQPANQLIEEFMLLANRTVASFIAESPGPPPFVYRTHDKPDAEKIQALREYVTALGFELPLHNGNPTSRDLNFLLESVRESPKAPIIETAALRAMAKAKYTVENPGHYGLGFENYTHFTSPIRRYPDLLVHRFLKQYLKRHKIDVELDQLKEQCRHCSEKERNAEEAERESIKLKQVEYMVQHVGDSFAGIVSGVTNFGIFVELADVLVEGMIPLREMFDDFYEYDEKRYMLIGRDTGKKIQLGDEVRVVVSRADIETRQIDLTLAE